MIKNKRPWPERHRRRGFALGWAARIGVLAALVAGGSMAEVGCEPKARHPPGAYQGVVELDERVLGFEVAGRVIDVEVDRGTQVKAGQLLARLDDSLEQTARASRESEAAAADSEVALLKAGSRPEDVRSLAAQVRGARASEDLLQKSVQRERALLSTGAVAQASVDDVQSRLDQAIAARQALEQRLYELKRGARPEEVDSAEAHATAAARAVKSEAQRIDLHELRSLSSGTVLDRHVEVGEVVGAGTPVLTIADTTHPYADVFVPEGELAGIRVGAPVQLTVDATPQGFLGHVENVGRKTEFTPRFLFSERERPNLVIRVRVRLDDPDQRLAAGLPAFVVIERIAAPPGQP